jgi:hypothetical protein
VKVGNGALSEHLKSIRKQKGLPERKAPPLRSEFYHIWNIFAELNHCRGSTGFGPAPISYTDIAAYGKLMGVDLTPFEVRAIRSLDNVYLETTSQSEGSGKDG